ncbi:MAG: tyrosine-type recombinase/integrase, partial [Thermomicrobiales bacterium]
SGIRMLFRRIKVELDLPLLTAHQMRHTAFTMMIKRGVDLHSVKRIAGHASVTTTEAYLALAGEDVKKKHTSGSPFDAISRRTQPI